MPNSIATQVLEDGRRNTVIKWTIVGDGSGDETATVIFDASAYKTASTANKLWEIEFSTVGASAILYWDATTDIPLLSIPANHSEKMCFGAFGGIINNAGTGITGDIVITTSGLGSNDHMTIIMWVKERGVPVTR
jgi:hypothetical protein